MTSLYICYQSVEDPLTQTQVVAYLEGLANAEYRLLLLTFEPSALADEVVRSWRDRLAGKGIIWHWLRYHKRPSVPATAWDVLVGIAAGLRLVRRHRVRLVHARGYVPGLMALGLKRLTGARFLFDVRGFMAEEYVDAGVWPGGGLLFRVTKRVERALVGAADAVVVLTQRARSLLQDWYPSLMSGKLTAVIPCCADLRSAHPTAGASDEAPPSRRTHALVYAGKLGGWYLDEEMVAFFAVLREALPKLSWHVWTQSDPAPLRELLSAWNLQQSVSIGRASPGELPARLRQATVALSLIKPCLSKLASSPTKVGEYLAAGLPVVSTGGIGDLDAILGDAGAELGGPVGVVLPECSETAYRRSLPRLLSLLADPATPGRCRAAAARHFDLLSVGWPRYRELYRRLIG
jgi:glycosyltransferase involved in cell wall biosynthesis